MGSPPAVGGEQPAYLAATKQLLYVASDAAGTELWSTDGTAAGTALVKDIKAGKESSGVSQFTACGAYVYFRADDGLNGMELWKTDGTAAGTNMVADMTPGPASSALSLGDCQTGQLLFYRTEGEGEAESVPQILPPTFRTVLAPSHQFLPRQKNQTPFWFPRVLFFSATPVNVKCINER